MYPTHAGLREARRSAASSHEQPWLLKVPVMQWPIAIVGRLQARFMGLAPPRLGGSKSGSGRRTGSNR